MTPGEAIRKGISLDALRNALEAHCNVVLTASPGAGKTTHVPLALLNEPWRGDRRILLLEPRRLAARAAAHRMAVTRGESVGDTVGYILGGYRYGDATEDMGKFTLTVRRGADSRWLIASDMDNGNRPMRRP